MAALTLARSFDPVWADLHHGLTAASSFFAVERNEVAAARQALEPLNVDNAVSPNAEPFTAVPRTLHEGIRLYVIGHLHARLGEFEAALAVAGQITALDSSPRDSSFLDDWSRGVQADVASRQNRPHHALALLEGARLKLSYAQRLVSTPFLSQDFERYLRAELLEGVGRDEDALRWYDAVSADFVHEVVYLAPSYLRRAKIHDRRGDYLKACEFYQRFIVLWRDAEPDEAAIVADAQRRLVRIGGRVVRPAEQLV
jgi:tetratricopeptide (TPR) repeat protein